MAKVGEGTSPRNAGLDHPRGSFCFQSLGKQVWDEEADRDSEKGTYGFSYAFISGLLLLSSLNARVACWAPWGVPVPGSQPGRGTERGH